MTGTFCCVFWREKELEVTGWGGGSDTAVPERPKGHWVSWELLPGLPCLHKASVLGDKRLGWSERLNICTADRMGLPVVTLSL